MNPVSQSVFLNALGWSLLNSLWQMAAVWLLYFLITAGGRRFTANVRYRLGFLTILLGLACFIFYFIGQYFNAEHFLFTNIPPLTATGIYSGSAWFAGLQQIIHSGLPYFSSVYLAVLVIQFTRYSSYYYHSRRLGLTGMYDAPEAYRHFVANACIQLGIQKKVTLWLSAVAESPMTAGFLKSVILIPLATFNHLTTSQVEAILVHELAHIRRNDYLLNLTLTAMGILFFFNPFARLLVRQVRKEAENCCDDSVMHFKYDPHTYISALLSLENARPRHQFALAAVGRDHRALLQRVKRIAGQHEAGRSEFKKIGIGLCMFLASFFITSIVPQHQPMPAPAENKLKLSAFTINYPERLVSYQVAPQNPPGASLCVACVLPVKKIQLIRGETCGKDSVSSVIITGADEFVSENEHISFSVQDDAAEKDYSILQTDRLSGPVTEIPSAYTLPYVPQASFDYKTTVDSGALNEADELTYEQKMDKDNLQKALVVLDGMDWQKINNTVKTTREKSGQRKLQLQINKSLALIDWQKANKQLLNNEEELRLKENLLLHLQLLNRPARQLQQTMEIIQSAPPDQKKLNQVLIFKRKPLVKHRVIVYI